MYLTLDSSVIVAGLREDEEKHEECRKLMEKVKEGEYVAFEPCTVLIEVAAAIKKTDLSKCWTVPQDLATLPHQECQDPSDRQQEQPSRDIDYLFAVYFLLFQ
jgi:predicted nucleic acid-binding protein